MLVAPSKKPIALAILSVSFPAAAEVDTQPSVMATEPLQPQNVAPPSVDRIVPERFERPEATVRVGQVVRIMLQARDPGGRPLSVAALGAPQGASFSESLRTLTWTPRAEQRGTHVVRFVVSNGVREASRTLVLRVTENRPPSFGATHHSVQVGEAAQLSFAATDPDGDVLSFSAVGLPSGARLDPDTGILSWQPTESDVDDYQVPVTAFDGADRTTQIMFIEVREPDDVREESQEWESYLLPGLGYALYAPREKNPWGRLHGISLEVVAGAWIHRNDNRGPSHGRIYVSAELLDSTERDVPILFTYALGFSLSLERNPHRTWLVPVYGLDLGGMLHRDMGSHFQSTPYLGVHFYSNPNVFVSGRGGYRLVPTDIETLGGWHASIGGVFSIW